MRRKYDIRMLYLKYWNQGYVFIYFGLVFTIMILSKIFTLIESLGYLKKRYFTESSKRSEYLKQSQCFLFVKDFWDLDHWQLFRLSFSFKKHINVFLKSLFSLIFVSLCFICFSVSSTLWWVSVIKCKIKPVKLINNCWQSHIQLHTKPVVAVIKKKQV